LTDPTQHKIDHFGDVPQAKLLASYVKTKPNTTKAHIHQSKEIYNNKINTSKCSAVAEMSDRLAAIDMGRKLGDCCATFFEGGSWVPI